MPANIDEWRRRPAGWCEAAPTVPANGAPAPPRDGLGSISDLYDLFDFDR
jgi:hypothetical protein